MHRYECRCIFRHNSDADSDADTIKTAIPTISGDVTDADAINSVSHALSTSGNEGTS
jgi:hypothetical protein